MVLRRATLAAVTVLGGLGLAMTQSVGAAVVAPDQHFIGVVNGNHTHAVVYMVCSGPAYPSQTGHPAGNQYLATILVATASGFTGSSASTIVARFAADPSIAVSLPVYGVAKAIPQQELLPCSGTGKVTFSPSPTSSTAVSDSIPVTFENLAV